MILKKLYDYAQNAEGIPKRGTELKEIPYVIVIDLQGRFLRFECKRTDRRSCTTFIVPQGVQRTSAPKTNTLWDNGKYVLGFGEKDAACHDLFVERIRKIAERHSDDESAAALSRFYETPIEEIRRCMETDPLYNDAMDSYKSNFSFRLEGDTLIMAEKTYLADGFDEVPEGVGKNGVCLVTGEYGNIVRTTTPTPLPGNSPMAALVSFQVNSGYDSYGKSQAYNAPISTDAEWGITAALKQMLGKESRNKANIGKRTFLFWSGRQNEAGNDLSDCLAFLLDRPAKTVENGADNAEKVKRLIKAIYSGEIRTTLDDRFYILGLAPNIGRIAVVFWTDCQLREFAGKLLAHFSDMDIADTRPPQNRKPYSGIFAMISAVTLGGKISDALPGLPEAIMGAIVNGTSYPMVLYTGALERIRQELSDYTVNIQRAAILKAYINRTEKKNQHKQLKVMLDKTNDNPGYLCGRLAAVLEKIQNDINGGDSIRTRYMGSASSTPATVFPAMLNVSIHHCEKLNDAARIYFEQLKQEILYKMPVDGFPAHLGLSDQGRFFVGYYHQRADLYAKKENKE